MEGPTGREGVARWKSIEGEEGEWKRRESMKQVVMFRKDGWRSREGGGKEERGQGGSLGVVG